MYVVYNLTKADCVEKPGWKLDWRGSTYLESSNNLDICDWTILSRDLERLERMWIGRVGVRDFF